MRIPPEVTFLSPTQYLDAHREMARELEDREAARSGIRIEEAREIVARKIGASPGTLFNLRKDRLKDLGGFVAAGLRNLLVKELEAEVVRLEHEIARLRQLGAPSDGIDLLALANQVQAIREALKPKS